MQEIGPIVEAAKAFGNGPFAAVALAVFALWAAQQVISLRRSLQQARTDNMKDVISIIESLQAKTKLNFDFGDNIILSLVKQLENSQYQETPMLFWKILSCYVAGVIVTSLRYFIVKNRFLDHSESIMNTFQVEILERHHAYTVGVAFIPLLSAAFTWLILGKKDALFSYIFLGFLFSILIPFFITAVLQCFGIFAIWQHD